MLDSFASRPWSVWVGIGFTYDPRSTPGFMRPVLGSQDSCPIELLGQSQYQCKNGMIWSGSTDAVSI